MNFDSLVHKFSAARSEFHSPTLSVYDRFVAPPYINKLDLAEIDHSMAIVGGRGCGKTTYIRYFSHWTQFDKNRPSVLAEELKCIILYWKPDTAYCRSMSVAWLDGKNSEIFFKAYSGLCLFKELVDAIVNISHHFPAVRSSLEQSELFWRKIKKITNCDFASIEDVHGWIGDAVFDVETAINTNDADSIVKFDAKSVLNLLLPAIKSSSKELSASSFKIFVDEFENLAEYQQKIVNNYRKHSDAALSWNVAHKRYAIVSTCTDGDEQLQSDDFREYILDDLMKNEKEEKFFLRELLLLGLFSVGLKSKTISLNPILLGDRSKLSLRSEDGYVRAVESLTKKMLPNSSNRELAKIAMGFSSVSSIANEVLMRLDLLKKKDAKKIIEEHPDVAIATINIVNQKSFEPSDLVSYVESGFSQDHSYHGRVKTYLVSSLLNLNSRFSYIKIPIYSGFERYCQISSKNLRNFMDLFYNALKLMDVSGYIDFVEDLPSITLECMHDGAINYSASKIREIPSYSPKGLTLSNLVNRLGGIFEIWQKGINASEPEKIHFYILHDFGSLSKEFKEVIDSAKCWRVLIEFPATKDKNSNKSSGYEYLLNPIYSPYFTISYRKIRRLELKEEEFKTICFGSSEEYEHLRKQHIEKASRGKHDSERNIAQGKLFE